MATELRLNRSHIMGRMNPLIRPEEEVIKPDPPRRCMRYHCSSSFDVPPHIHSCTCGCHFFSPPPTFHSSQHDAGMNLDKNSLGPLCRDLAGGDSSSWDVCSSGCISHSICFLSSRDAERGTLMSFKSHYELGLWLGSGQGTTEGL